MTADADADDTFWLRSPLGAMGSLREWLLDSGSLTARLKAVCADFEVRVLRQARTRASRDEACLLGLPAGRSLMARDVLLVSGSAPLIFAHSVLRADDVHGAWRAIASMGTRPLGAALFADPRIRRGPLRYRKLRDGHPLYCAAAAVLGQTLPPLWARRSVFELQGAPLLVTEAFLPALAGRWHTSLFKS
jgi:chorismate--pyruvate lyase